MKKKDDYTIIIGCGRLGANLANTLSNEGENVLIMDETKDSFRRLASNYGGLSVVGSGTEFNKLKEAEIERASAVIAVTNDDNTNIMVAQIAREVFNVRKVIARLHDPECEIVYQELGIDTICPAVLSAKEIDKLLDGFHKKEALA
ncbi:MAG: TrkA family potassium uptake protein [Anaerolineaceae bacterium]|nr:TrkA family potassium uptake protein [Anaerolineaceae bacterium]